MSVYVREREWVCVCVCVCVKEREKACVPRRLFFLCVSSLAMRLSQRVMSQQRQPSSSAPSSNPL